MEQMDGKSLDIVSENILKLKKIFPEVFNEDKVDLEKLGEILGEYRDNNTERYNFSWPGKAKAIRIAQTPSTGTLRPCKEESKNWDETQNLYIEGDNLEVLKLLQKSYYGKIKMIYIDPPYNTGNDFVYKDDFKDNVENYLAITGQKDEEGNKLTTNTESSGRYHSNWLNMMYPRLKLARNLLKDEGTIFISIDDNEAVNLKKVCDEIFGEVNYIGDFVKQSKVGGGSDSKHIAKEHETLLVYAKNINNLQEMYEEHDEEYLKRYKEKDEIGRYYWDTFARNGLKNPINYDIIAPDGTMINGNWIRSKERFQDEYSKGIVRITKKQDGNWSVQFKQYLNVNGKKPRSMTTDFGGTIEGKKEIENIFLNDKIFSYPKSTVFINKLMKFISFNDNDIILDFFSGSATTGHSVYKLNRCDSGKRKFILVQLPEATEEKSEAYKSGYSNICEIGKERLRRAGEKLKKEIENDLDIGFKVFKLDSSNINKWDSSNDNNMATKLYEMVENIKSGRTEEDILYEVLLKYGIDLNMPIEEHIICGKKVFDIGFGAIIACLDDNITLDVVEGIGKLKQELEPDICRVVFMDNGFATDSVKTNAVQILKRYNIEDVKSI